MRRYRIAFLSALLTASMLIVAAPATAGTSSVSWSYPTGLTLGGEIEIRQLPLAEPAGSECTAYVEVSNNPSSIHPGNNLNVYLNGAPLLSLDGFENGPGSPTAGSAEFVATGSDQLTVFIEGPQWTSSDGSLRVTCELPPPPPGGGEGCTPGYWKQPHHFDSWVGYAPGDSFDSVFGVSSSFDSLLDGVSAKGGKENALARHAVAALLNASSADVSYEYTTAQVIAAVQGAYATGNWNATKDMFEEQNEAGCPLN